MILVSRRENQNFRFREKTGIVSVRTEKIRIRIFFPEFLLSDEIKKNKSLKSILKSCDQKGFVGLNGPNEELFYLFQINLPLFYLRMNS